MDPYEKASAEYERKLAELIQLRTSAAQLRFWDEAQYWQTQIVELRREWENTYWP